MGFYMNQWNISKKFFCDFNKIGVADFHNGGDIHFNICFSKYISTLLVKNTKGYTSLHNLQILSDT